MTPAVDYVPVIRAELERGLLKLKAAFDSTIHTPTRATVGYLIAAHKGRPVITEDDELAGLPVTLDLLCPRTLTVYGRDPNRYSTESKREVVW